MPARERKKLNLKIFLLVVLVVANLGAMTFAALRVVNVLQENKDITGDTTVASTASGGGGGTAGDASIAGITVKTSLFDTTVSFPASMLADLYPDDTAETYIARMGSTQGVKSAEQDGDAIVLKINKDYRNTMAGEMYNDIQNFLKELVNGTETPAVQEAEYSKDMSLFTIKVSTYAFSVGEDKELTRPLATKAVFYQALAGTEAQGTTITFVDMTSGETLDTISYPG